MPQIIEVIVSASAEAVRRELVQKPITVADWVYVNTPAGAIWCHYTGIKMLVAEPDRGNDSKEDGLVITELVPHGTPIRVADRKVKPVADNVKGKKD